MLGFVSISDESGPFNVSQKNIDPMMGTATLTMNNVHWDCFYRPMYENWRGNFFEPNASKHNFWAVVFYCPTLDPAHCVPQIDPFETEKDKITESLTMHSA